MPAIIPRLRLWVATAVLGATVLAACASDEPTGPDSVDGPYTGPLTVSSAGLRAFTEATVVDPATGTVTPGRTVIVEGDRIVEVGGGGTPIPAGADVVEVGGAWIMPGLIDMHVHMRSGDTEAYVRSGITRVRNMWGYSTLGALVARIESGELIGPALHTLSSGLDRPPVYWPETQLVETPAAADSVVGRMFEAGYRELKLYQDLTPAVYDAIVAAAEARGMTFAGHKPSSVPLAHVIESGQRSIEHLGGYRTLQGSALDEAVELTVQARTWNCPTLAILNRGGGDGSSALSRRAVTRALFDGGARLLIGTDAGIERTAPGASLAQEMDEFLRAGIPRSAIVRMVTVDAAEYLGLAGELGAVEPGRRADLVLLSANPLESLDALRRPLGVLMGERWIDMR